MRRSERRARRSALQALHESDGQREDPHRQPGKGKKGDDNSALLGAILASKMHRCHGPAPMFPKTGARIFCLYVDEFQFFATILSEVRECRLNLTLAHQ